VSVLRKESCDRESGRLRCHQLAFLQRRRPWTWVSGSDRRQL